MISAQDNRKGFLRENFPYGGGDFLTGLYGDRGIDNHIAHIDPAFAFEDGAVAVDVIEAVGQIVSILLGVFTQVARAVAFSGLPPGAFIEWHAKHGEISMQLVEVRLVGRAEEGSHADKSGSGLRWCKGRQRYRYQANRNYGDG